VCLLNGGVYEDTTPLNLTYDWVFTQWQAEEYEEIIKFVAYALGFTSPIRDGRNTVGELSDMSRGNY